MLTVKINSRTIEGKSRLQVAPLDINNVRTFVLIGDTAPLVGDGSDGYYFLDTSGDISFYKKIAGAWVLQTTFRGDPGDDAYVYIAYASDASGTGFTMVFDAGLDYIAIKNTTVAIGSPAVGDFAGLWKNYKGPAGPGSGDMLLGTAQTVTAVKTFLNAMMKLRNVADTFSGWFANTNTADRVYTLPDRDITVAGLDDITGTNSGTNTGDNATNTQYSGLAASKEDVANKDVSGGYVGKTLEKINFWNAARTFMSFFVNAATAARTYTFPDKNITVAGLDDITGTNSGTNTGDQSYASISETNTGTEAAKIVTPDGLAGSNFGKVIVDIGVLGIADAWAVGDGKYTWYAPAKVNGMNLVDVFASLDTVSSSGIPTVQIHNLRHANDVLSTKLTIDASEKTSGTAATAAVINATYDDVATNDGFRIDIDVAGTGTTGLMVRLVFQLP